MALKTFKPKRQRNSILRLTQDYPFRDDIITIGKRQFSLVFLNSVYNNPFRHYQAVSIPVAAATYKVRVASEDSKENINSPGTDPEAFATVSVIAFTLSPIDIEFTISGSNVTFTWEHSKTGAPDNYVFYGAKDSDIIDRSTPLDIISGSLKTNTLTLVNADWKIVIEAIVSGKESQNLFTSEFTLPATSQKPPRPGLPATSNPNNSFDASNPFVSTGLELTNISVAKVRIRFYWLWGDLATTFRIFHNSGSGDIDFVTPAFTFSKQDGLIQSFTTTQLHSSDEDKTFKFAVRSVSAFGVEDGNSEEFEIVVKGVPPDLIEDILLDTVL